MANPEDASIDSQDAEVAFITGIIEQVGPRLPGSDEERRAAELLMVELTQASGSPAVMEGFTCATKASIGLIPALGYMLLFVVVPLSFFFPLITGFLIAFFLVFAFVQIFKYLAWFDVLFPKSRSQNVYSVVEPRSGGVQGTIVLGAHVDSSWHSPIIFKHPRQARPRLIYGVAGVAVYGVILLVRGLASPAIVESGWNWWNLVVIPFLPGFYFVSQYITWNKALASPGAMDDLAGVSITLWLARHVKQHPAVVPENCRVVYAFFGCEEAGLKGSRAFVAKHKDDLLSGNCSVILVDGVSDFDYFHVVSGDAWLGTNYDPALVAMADDVMSSLQIKHDIIKNPEGSTDGASFSRAGIKVVTLAAQDTGPASNYHTRGDLPGRIDGRVIARMKRVVLELVRRVGAAASPP